MKEKYEVEIMKILNEVEEYYPDGIPAHKFPNIAKAISKLMKREENEWRERVGVLLEQNTELQLTIVRIRSGGK